ncbi:hypothetical protein [Chitinimonas sp.]|uniref:hypothetical protein n=1 Tax=Chitinimonas sp. TaxID=1934313 RepID=UPI0035B0D13A
MFFLIMYGEEVTAGTVIGAELVSGVPNPASASVSATSSAVKTIAEEKGFVQTFSSFRRAKAALGTRAGEDIRHVVEQCQIGRSGFTRSAINSTNYLVRVGKQVHQDISAAYLSLVPGAGKTFRDLMNGRPFDEQMKEGLEILNKAINGTLK